MPLPPHFSVAEQNPNEHFGVRACSFAGHIKSVDCGGKWVFAPTQHVRIASALAPHVCVCENHLRTALEAVAPSPPRKSPRGSRAVGPAKPLEDLSL